MLVRFLYSGVDTRNYYGVLLLLLLRSTAILCATRIDATSLPLPLPRDSSPSFLPQGGAKTPVQPNPIPESVPTSINLIVLRMYREEPVSLTPVKSKKKQFKTIKTNPIKKEKNRLLVHNSGPGVDKGTQQVRVK